MDREYILNVMSQERWEILRMCKRSLFSTGDTSGYKEISPEVADSWVRSRNMGVDPHNPPVGKALSRREQKKILEECDLLIYSAKPLIESFKNMVRATTYRLELIDSRGVLILGEGELHFLPPFAAQGMVFNEYTMGTNAHTLSMFLKKPVQLLGPEHYCVALENTMASAAPIFGDAGEAIASLVLTQPLDSVPWDEAFQKLRAHTLGLITSMAKAIEAQMKLRLSNENLKVTHDHLRTAYDTLEATLASVDEGIITVDRHGMIIRTNQEGAGILKLTPEELGKRNIREFLDSQSCLMSIAAKGRVANIEETVCIGTDEQPYVVSVRPIMKDGVLEAAVLRLNHAEKINSLVTSRSGAVASFQFEDIVGESKAIKKAVETAKRFAGTPENVLLIGESGTGKELFAQAIHNRYRPNGPFMAVNCAAMPRELIESELFGYEGGSFTGAERSGRPGKIELAHGGTLFLDEIGDMPLELQAVLLRVLEDKQVLRIGGRRYKKVDFRVVAATNKDLFKMVKENLFREDLYYRLSVLSVNIPPLRERDGDAEILSRHFLNSYCHKMGWKTPRVGASALKIIREYEWPGNVRQLQNAMCYAVNTVQRGVIEVGNLPDNILRRDIPQLTFGEGTLSLRMIEKAAIDLALERSKNSVPRAAKLLGISKATLYRKLKEFEDQPQ